MFDAKNGISFDCQGNRIEGNSSGYGIYLESGSNNTIKNCIVSLFSTGIYLHYSDINTLTNNTVNYNQEDGICIHRSNENTLTQNIANFNYNGIHLLVPRSNKIENITANHNRYGFYIYRAVDDYITGNLVSCNNHTGIYIYGKSRERIYHNNLINNSEQAYDNDGFGDTTWHNGSKGNYYSDYPGDDLNGDGIGDTPYNISGGIRYDNYPLMRPYGECSVKGDYYPCDETVLIFELLDYINLWGKGKVSLSDVIDAIKYWILGQ